MQLQWAIVSVLVAVSVLYAAWRLMPMRYRLRLLEHLLPEAASRTPLGRWRARVRGTMMNDAARGCQGCAPESRVRR